VTSSDFLVIIHSFMRFVSSAFRVLSTFSYINGSNK